MSRIAAVTALLVLAASAGAAGPRVTFRGSQPMHVAVTIRGRDGKVASHLLPVELSK